MRVEIVPFASIPYRQSVAIREEILRKPLGMEITKGDIYDEDKHVHFLAIEEHYLKGKHTDKAVGVVVLVPNYEEGVGKLRQMATIEAVRGKGYGKILAWQLEKYARRKGMHKVVLHARYHAVGFYEKLGYHVCSEEFQEVGIAHYKMQKELNSKA